MLNAHELLGFMSPSLATDIIAYAYEADKPLYRVTVNAVAEARKVRPVFLERQPRSERHATMLTTLTRPSMELVAGNLIRTWLVKKQKAMLVDFLNALASNITKGWWRICRRRWMTPSSGRRWTRCSQNIQANRWPSICRPSTT